MPIDQEAAGREKAEKPGPERRVPESAKAGFGEDGPPVVDDQAGLSEPERFDEAVEDLSEKKD